MTKTMKKFVGLWSCFTLVASEQFKFVNADLPENAVITFPLNSENRAGGHEVIDTFTGTAANLDLPHELVFDPDDSTIVYYAFLRNLNPSGQKSWILKGNVDGTILDSTDLGTPSTDKILNICNGFNDNKRFIYGLGNGRIIKFDLDSMTVVVDQTDITPLSISYQSRIRYNRGTDEVDVHSFTYDVKKIVRLNTATLAYVEEFTLASSDPIQSFVHSIDGTKAYILYSDRIDVCKASNYEFISTLVGASSSGSNIDGADPDASLEMSYDITISNDGLRLYITSRDGVIREIVIATGVVTTIAGQDGKSSQNVDGGSDPLSAELQSPQFIAISNDDTKIGFNQNRGGYGFLASPPGPTAAPTSSPTIAPTSSPTDAPSMSPTLSPTTKADFCAAMSDRDCRRSDICELDKDQGCIPQTPSPTSSPIELSDQIEICRGFKKRGQCKVPQGCLWVGQDKACIPLQVPCEIWLQDEEDCSGFHQQEKECNTLNDNGRRQCDYRTRENGMCVPYVERPEGCVGGSKSPSVSPTSAPTGSPVPPVPTVSPTAAPTLSPTTLCSLIKGKGKCNRTPGCEMVGKECAVKSPTGAPTQSPTMPCAVSSLPPGSASWLDSKCRQLGPRNCMNAPGLCVMDGSSCVSCLV